MSRNTATMPKESEQPIEPGADENLLETYVFGKSDSSRRAERLVRSARARKIRATVKSLKERKTK